MPLLLLSLLLLLLVPLLLLLMATLLLLAPLASVLLFCFDFDRSAPGRETSTDPVVAQEFPMGSILMSNSRQIPVKLGVYQSIPVNYH